MHITRKFLGQESYTGVRAHAPTRAGSSATRARVHTALAPRGSSPRACLQVRFEPRSELLRGAVLLHEGQSVCVTDELTSYVGQLRSVPGEVRSHADSPLRSG